MEVIIIIIGLILDRITKNFAKSNLSYGHKVTIIKDIFDFSYLENSGAAFGIFQNKIFILSIVTIIIIILIIYFLFKKKSESKMLRAGLSMIICGALGNLYDRINYKYVVDFIFVHYKNTYTFPIFNVADIFVTIGTLIIAIYIIRDGSSGEKRSY